MSTVDEPGQLLREARRDAGIGLDRMAQLTRYSKSYLGMVETGQRPVTADMVIAYERAIGPVGDDMWRRRNITHPKVMQLKKPDLVNLVRAVESGEPDSLLNTPTSLAADELLVPRQCWLMR